MLTTAPRDPAALPRLLITLLALLLLWPMFWVKLLLDRKSTRLNSSH